MGQPVVLILDDVHWADDASLELIAHLLRRPPPAPDADRARVPRRAGAEQPAGGARGGRRATARHRASSSAPLTQAEADALLGAPAQPLALPPERRQPVLPARSWRARRCRAAHLDGEAEARRRAARGRRRARAGDRRAGRARAPAARLGRGRRGRAGRPRPRGGRGRPRRGARRWPRSTSCSPRDVAAATDVPRRYRFRHPLVRRAVYDGAGEAWRLRRHARAAAALAARPGALAARAHHVERSARVGDEAAARCSSRPATQAAAARARGRRALVRGGAAAARAAGAATTRPAARRCSSRWPARWPPPGGWSGRSTRWSTRSRCVELAELRVRLIAACAACENVLGRHDAAHARLLARARRAGRPRRRGGGRAAGRARRRRALRQRLRGDAAAGRRAPPRPRGRSRTAGCEALATALLCFAEYNLGDRRRGRDARARRAPRCSTRCPTTSWRCGSTRRTTSASPSTSASATTTRSATCGAASTSRARSARASSSCR